MVVIKTIVCHQDYKIYKPQSADFCIRNWRIHVDFFVFFIFFLRIKKLKSCSIIYQAIKKDFFPKAKDKAIDQK